MYRIPVINQSTLFEDMNREALVQGKIEILDPVSSNQLTIWSYSDDEYSVMENPVILDIEGRVTQTVFCDRIVYCRVYKYEGLDENRHPIYSFVRDFYAGENENSESRDYVEGIEAMKDLDPAVNSSVNVIGYYNSSDCGLRTYVWDPNSTLDPDGGYVIKSDVSDTGRWLLNFDGEYIPSSYYGVYPGSEANINALASYVGVINGKKTAPGIYFIPGNYTFVTNFATTKKVMVDANTSFACTYFDCDSVDVKGQPTSPIADFIFNSGSQVAHSSWFRTLKIFWYCGADTLIIDNTNNFTNSVIDSEVSISNKTIMGTSRISATYSGSGKLHLTQCKIVGNKIFNTSDKVTFSNMTFRDEWFSQPANIDFVNNVSVRSTSMDIIELSNFSSETAYVNAISANGETRLNMQGRYMSSLTIPASVTEVLNVNCGTLICNIPSANISMTNVKATSANITCNLLTMDDSVVTFANEPNITTVGQFRNSTINGYTWSNAKAYSFTNCTVGINFNMATDNDSSAGSLVFTNCVFDSGKYMNVKHITMRDCVTNNLTMKIYPLKVSGVYYMNAILTGNTFVNTNPIEFTKFADDNCYEVVVNWDIQNNVFSGNSSGIECRYWQNRTGSNWDKVFIAPDDRSVIVYKGNTGACPNESTKGESTPAGMTPYQTIDIGGGINIYLYTRDLGRICPRYGWQESSTTYNKLYNVGTQSPATPMLIDTNDNMNVKVQNGVNYWQIARSYPDRNGDFFTLGVAIWILQLDSHDIIVFV